MTESKTSVLIIYTGGTIGMVQEAQTGLFKPFDFDHLLQQVPELKNFDYQLSAISFEEPLDSSDIDPTIWERLAETIKDNYDEFDGFVILHGSDTMAYTASGLSFMLENLNKPVILTGSQLPMGMIRTDGKENLITAIEIAGAKKEGMPVIPDVAIYFENMLLQGNRTIKYNAEHFEAFQSPNHPLLAEAGVRIKYNYSAIRKANLLPLRVVADFNTSIAVLKLFPGISETAVKAILETGGIKAVIMETYGSGNAPTAKWFIDLIRKAVDEGVVIFNVTQCKSGSVEQGRYETSTLLKKYGVISGSDITFEAAVAKIMFLLGNHNDKDEVKKLLQQPLRREMQMI